MKDLVDVFELIGGMGAFEYSPEENTGIAMNGGKLDLHLLSELAELVLSRNDNFSKELANTSTHQDALSIIRVGSSAGGARSKALVARDINGNFFDGSVDAGNDKSYWLLKFDSKENKTVGGQVQFAGFRDHFNIIVIHPEGRTKTIDISKVAENELNVTIASGKSQSYDFSIYVGPQDTASMKKYGKGFEKAVAFSRFWLLNTISFAIYYTIPFLHLISRSWGLSIILISLIIYGLSYPLTVKSMMSMRKMQQVQPKIKALQERFKDDPTKLNAEIMEIYKREKINPLGGCLPFLLQMPLFVSLYQVLWRSYYFQGQSFLWIKDLSLPDRLMTLPFSLPFLGNELNILPILMGIVMFFQQKVSAKNTVAADEQQAMQQKMMMYFFPFFIGFIFYKFASGLSLYFTVFYALSTWTQVQMSKTK